MADPADMLARAEEMLAEGEGGLDTWITDQHEAAAAELQPVLHWAAKDMNVEPHQAGSSPREIAFKLAVVESIQRRADPRYRCPHSRSLTPPPLIVDLGAGMIACRSCALLFDLPVNEDGRCDLCDRPTKMFNPLWIELGPALFHGDTCGSCKAWLMGDQGTTG